jgi:hypothetical protein
VILKEPLRGDQMPCIGGGVTGLRRSRGLDAGQAVVGKLLLKSSGLTLLPLLVKDASYF